LDLNELYSFNYREALEKERKAADYARRHAAGETDAAKADLARLAEVRRRREAQRLAREAEGRKPGWTQNGIESSDEDGSDDDSDGEKKAPAAPVQESAAAAKRRAAAAAPAEEETAASASGSGAIPKLKAMDIKKMNPDMLKTHLKARNLDIQVQKKDLMKRLCDFEAARED
jgi:hypothetical protein